MSRSLYRFSFPAGFRPLAERLSRRDFGADSVEGGDESSLLVRPETAFRDPLYIQGVALIIDSASVPDLETAYRAFAARLGDADPREAVSRVARDKAFMKAGRAERFALRAFIGAEPTFPGTEPRGILEAAIEKETKLRADSAHPDIEFAVSLRADGIAYFSAALRLNRGPSPRAGELPRHTARLLCELSGPRGDDVFLDPFMGSGAIPLERALMGPYNMIFASDREEKELPPFKERLKEKPFERRRKTIFPKTMDARDLSRFQDAFFTSIVTDPPWGDYERIPEEELIGLYGAFLKEAHRVCRADAAVVLLVGRSDVLDRGIAASGAPWLIGEDLPVLVSGKKARAVVLRR